MDDLIDAIKKKDINRLKELIDNGADINVKDKHGYNLLHIAIIDEKYELVPFLLEKGIDINAKVDINGYSALMLSIRSPQHTTVESNNNLKFLLEKGADINTRTYYKLTVLHRAVQIKNNDNVKFFLEKGLDINATDADGSTVLHTAVMYANFNIIPYLLEKGVDKSIINKNGQTAYQVAQFRISKGFDIPETILESINYVEEDNSGPYSGYSKEDAEQFNLMFEKPNDWSFCPICLSFTERQDGCMYMHHVCPRETRHEELYKLFKDSRNSREPEIEWCTICGRITQQHQHFIVKDAESILKTGRLPNKEPITPEVEEMGVERHFDSDCKKVGGGGAEEKFKRVFRLLDYACQLQKEIGNKDLTNKVARKELVEEIMIAPLSRDRRIEKALETKKFDAPCDFSETNKQEIVASEDAPDIKRPINEKDLVPTEHKDPDNVCLAEMGEHEDKRSVWQFHHIQSDGSVWDHNNEYMCGEDLENTIKAKIFDGVCPINPGNCKAKMYPEEIKNIVSPEYYESYRKLFNEKFKQGAKRKKSKRKTQKRFRFKLTKGGNVPSLLHRIDLNTATCVAPPPKNGGTRKRKTKKIKTMRKRI